MEKIRERAGYIFGYFLFTSVLYFILRFTDRVLPYYGVMGITLLIAVIGTLLKRYLK